MRSIAALLWFLLAHVSSATAKAQQDDTYLGHLFTYEKAETYSSIFGGKVHLLEPGGFDVFRDTSRGILIEGAISAETTRNVKTLLERIPGIRMVFLNSPGGDLFAGLELGRVLAATDLQAIVHGKAQCASACALAFLGARSRLILTEPGAFGFHRQYYIKNGEIHYGSWRRDVATIDAYLKQVGFTGVKADEIVGTTGLITYSDNRLEDRGLITVPRREHQKEIDSILRLTGATITEKYMTSCLLVANRFDCVSVIFTFRLPMLLDYFSRNSAVVIEVEQMQRLRPIFRSVEGNKGIFEVNCLLMETGYVRYLNARLDALAQTLPAEHVLDSYRALVRKEVNSCTQLLRSRGKLPEAPQ